MNTKKNVKKRIIVGVFVFLLSAIPVLFSIYFTKPSLNVSEMIENENINDLSLTIYYLSPYTYMFYPVSSVEDLSHRCEKIVINGGDLKKHIDSFRQISNDDLKPIIWKSSDLDLRLYYVLESKKNGKLFDVAMWGKDGDSMIVNGYEAKGNNIFIDVIIPFLPEDKAESWEDFMIYGFDYINK